MTGRLAVAVVAIGLPCLADTTTAPRPAGTPVAGIQLSLHITRQDKGFVIHSVLTNVSSTPVRLYRLRLFHVHSPIQRSGFGNPDGVLKIKQLSGEPLKMLPSVSDCAWREREPTVILGVGQSLRERHPNWIRALPPGDYEFELVYYSKTEKLIEGASQDISSNKLVIRITP